MMNLIRKYVFNNYKLKALSLVLAAMLWFAISNIGESHSTFSVSVLTKNLGKDFIIKKTENDQVFVTVSGPISILKNLKPRDVSLVVNLSSAREGTNLFALQKTDVAAPKGIKVESIKPDYTALDIDKVVGKKLRTVVKLDDQWAGIYAIKAWNPDFVYVEGAKSSLSDKEFIETVPVDGRFKDQEEHVEVPVDTKGILARKIRPESIQVYLEKK